MSQGGTINTQTLEERVDGSPGPEKLDPDTVSSIADRTAQACLTSQAAAEGTKTNPLYDP